MRHIILALLLAPLSLLQAQPPNITAELNRAATNPQGYFDTNAYRLAREAWEKGTQSQAKKALDDWFVANTNIARPSGIQPEPVVTNTSALDTNRAQIYLKERLGNLHRGHTAEFFVRDHDPVLINAVSELVLRIGEVRPGMNVDIWTRLDASGLCAKNRCPVTSPPVPSTNIVSEAEMAVPVRRQYYRQKIHVGTRIIEPPQNAYLVQSTEGTWLAKVTIAIPGAHWLRLKYP